MKTPTGWITITGWSARIHLVLLDEAEKGIADIAAGRTRQRRSEP